MGGIHGCLGQEQEVPQEGLARLGSQRQGAVQIQGRGKYSLFLFEVGELSEIWYFILSSGGA